MKKLAQKYPVLISAILVSILITIVLSVRYYENLLPVFARFSFRVGRSAKPAITSTNISNGSLIALTLQLSQDSQLFQNNHISKPSKYIIKHDEYTIVYTAKKPLRAGSRIRVVGRAQVRVNRDSIRQILLIDPDIAVVDIQKTTVGFNNNSNISSVTKIQDFLAQLLEKNLPEPHGSLLVGIILGIKRTMPSNFYQSLINTGTLHVIAASGYNITIVANLLITSLSGFFGKRTSLLGAIIGIIGYSLLAGASPAVIRAAIMATLAFCAKLVGKEYWASWSLILASILMLVVSPVWVKDIGFWLSVTATGGILWFSKPLDVKISTLIKNLPNSFWIGFANNRYVKSVLTLARTNLVTTLAAQLGTTPIIVLMFGRISVVSLFVNVLVLWLVPVIMFLGLVKLIFVSLSGQLGFLLGIFVWMPLHLFVVLVEVFGSINFASFQISALTLEESGPILWAGVFCYYMILFWWLVWTPKTHISISKIDKK